MKQDINQIKAFYRSLGFYFNDGKDFGTANFKDGNVDVKVEVRKKTSWDQEGLLNYLNTLSPDLAKHYAKVSVTVPT